MKARGSKGTNCGAGLALLALCLLLPGRAAAQWSAPDASNNIGSTNSGNVGVGTTDPKAKLDVRGGMAVTDKVGIGTTDPQAKLDVRGGAAVIDASQYLGFRRADNNAIRRLIGAADNGAGQHFVDVGQSTGYITGIRFWPRDNQAHPDVVFSSGGNVGIGLGSATPGYRLHIAGDNSEAGGRAVLKLQNTQAGGVGNSWWLYAGAQGVAGAFGVYDQTAGAYRMFFDASGHVGVGTVSPGSLFSVNGTVGIGSVGAASRLQISSDGYGAVLFQNDNSPIIFKTQSGTQEKMRITDDGNVGIGIDEPAAKLDVKAGSNTAVAINVTGAISATGAITGATVSASYQDVAEWVPSVQELRAGTVVVLDAGRTNHVIASSSAYDTKVAGVVSEQPGVILGVAGEGKVKVATTGRVKVKADASRGAIKVGDLLVTSGVEGVAMKSVPVDLGGTQIHRPGTIIGKALEPLESGTGEILVLLSLQ